MKKIILVGAAFILSLTAMSQSEKYVKAMKKNIADIDSMYVRNNAAELANSFERIADAEKTQWLPYYYAAYCNIAASYTEKDKTMIDKIADKAEELIKKAEEIGGENSETNVIRSMIASTHMMVDPQSRWAKYGPASSGYMAKAKSLDSTNPRPILLEGQSKFYTPKAFGGGKDVAKPLFEQAIRMFGTFKPASELHPTWGMGTAKYFLSQCDE
jgi:hypothetical protein